MTRRLPWPATLLLIWSLLLTSVACASSIDLTVEQIVRTADLDAARVAVSIVEAGPGTPVVNLRGDEMMIPASNLKLLTSGAALHALGSSFAFRTRLVVDDDRLVVIGGGDPAFGDPALLAVMSTDDDVPMDVEAMLDVWVRPVVASGIERVRELAIDDRIFDRQLVHPAWPADQLNRRYCAEVSGLSFHLNVLHFYPVPREGRRPSLLQFEPKVTGLDIDNQATSNTGVHDADSVWIARRQRTNELTFYGNVKHRYQNPAPVTVHDMPALFGRILAERLRAAGVVVDGVRVLAPEEPDVTGSTIGPVIFTPIGTVITRCNRDSQNLYAECLLKRIGHAMTGQSGSWQNGAPIVRHLVHDRLADPGLSSKVLIVDGSGLSRDNRIAPTTLTAWLNSFHNDEELGALFIESLAVGGESGTLKSRLRTDEMHGALVQAKSGYINGVSCLSGFVTTSDGRRRCFSIMVNDLKAPVRTAKRMQDDIVRAVAEDMAAAPARLGSD